MQNYQESSQSGLFSSFFAKTSMIKSQSIFLLDHLFCIKLCSQDFRLEVHTRIKVLCQFQTKVWVGTFFNLFYIQKIQKTALYSTSAHSWSKIMHIYIHWSGYEDFFPRARVTYAASHVSLVSHVNLYYYYIHTLIEILWQFLHNKYCILTLK